MSALAILTTSSLLSLGAISPLEQQTEEGARAALSELLRTLCPEQCVLLSVDAQVEEEPVGDALPGFESLSGGTTVPRLRAIDVQLLADAQLPQAFRARLENLAQAKLAAFGRRVRLGVSVNSVSFPPRNAPHLEVPVQGAQAAPAPQPPIIIQSPPPPAAPQANGGHEVLLVLAGLMALIVLLVAGLLVLAVRLATRPREPEEALLPEPGEPERIASGSHGAQTAQRRQRLVSTLVENVPLRNALVRQALAAGEAQLVGEWIQVAGDFLIDDLRGDPALIAASSEIARTAAQSLEESRAEQVLRELEIRLLSLRMGHAPESLDAAFAFLERARPEAFALALSQMAPPAQELILRFAPAPLRTSFVARLEPARREALALAWVQPPSSPADYVLGVAHDFRNRLDSAQGAGRADEALRSLFEGLSRSEQDSLRRSLQTRGASLEGIFFESSVTETAGEALAAAVLAVDPADLRTYLAGTDEKVRSHVLSNLPRRLLSELQEELASPVRATGEAFRRARRNVLSAIEAEQARRPDADAVEAQSTPGGQA